MLAAVKKGRSVNEAEIPPPVATGAQSAAGGAQSDAPAPSVPLRPPPPVPSPPESGPSEQPVESVADIVTPNSEEEQSSSSTQATVSSVPSPAEPPEEPADRPPTDGWCQSDCYGSYGTGCVTKKAFDVHVKLKTCFSAQQLPASIACELQ